MREVRTAQRYARAIIELSDEMKNLDTLFRDFELLNSIILNVREFKLLLNNPVINTEKKKRLLSELLKDKVSELTMKFLLILTTKNREGLLPDIIHEFFTMRDEKLGILNVSVQTAVPFSSSQQDSLVRQLGSITKMKVKIKYNLDQSIRGGFKVQYQDTVWDASVQHQLDLLRKRFAEGTV
ncbi:MAG: ATP synthase F1 subunit delta [Ignavibacteriales bacterium]|nr:ATP synthase F1 subunit delta [Ignavibacteriales bacterium]